MVLFNLLKKRKRFAIGIDIGHSGLKVLVFRGDGASGRIERTHLINFAPGVISDGKVVEEDVVVEALRELKKREVIPKGKVVASVVGGDVEVKRIRLPVMSGRELERYVAMEAEQAFTLPFLSLTVDYVVLRESADYMDLLVVGVPREKVTLMRDLFYRADVDLHVLDVKPMGLYHLFVHLGGGDTEGLTVLMDVGKSVTTVVFVMNGELLCGKEVYVGGDMVTEMIQSREGVTYAEAERLKMEGFSQKEYKREVMDKFVISLGHELKLVLDSCRLWLESEEAEVKKVFYTGGGALLEDFGEAFEERFDVEAKSVYHLNSEDVLGERVRELDRYSVALGLSVRGAVA